MARNKHPEETVQKILDISLRLFSEKSYEATTIQDIVDALGMSKGAIYHHFKSKEEIIDATMTRSYNDICRFETLFQDTSKTGLEKLKDLFSSQLTDPNKFDLDRISLNLMDNPKMMILSLRSTIIEAGPLLQRLIEQGNQDGSLSVAQPKECAEVVLLLLNLWLLIFSTERDDFMRKVHFIKSFTDSMGLPLIDPTLLTICGNYYDQILAKRSPSGTK